MILTHSIKVCLATQPCDLRKSFDTLSALVGQQLREDPLSSKLFVFLNRKCDRVKMLYWDGTGLWILAKRLEKAGFIAGYQARQAPASLLANGPRLETRMRASDSQSARDRSSAASALVTRSSSMPSSGIAARTSKQPFFRSALRSTRATMRSSSRNGST